MMRQLPLWVPTPRRHCKLPITPRYVGLLWMSLLCLLFGAAYSPFSNIPHIVPLGLDVLTAWLPNATDSWNPAWVYGVLWAWLGVRGVYAVLKRKEGHLVFAGQTAVFTMWAAAYVAAFVLGDPRAWVTAGIFLVAAGSTWSFTRVDPPLRAFVGKARLRWIRLSQRR